MEIIERLEVDFNFKDERGSLTQLVHNGFSQINVLISKKGVTRGGHFHKRAIECFYVVSGSVIVDAKKENDEEQAHFTQGQFFKITQNVIHSMHFPEDCVLVAMYDICVENEDGSKDIYPAE